MNSECKVLVASESGISIRSSHDITDAIGACLSSHGLILNECDLSSDFFNLRTGLAGEFIQKCVNYRVRVAIVLSDVTIYGERFRELAFEHATHEMVRFFRAENEARAWFLSVLDSELLGH